jgi:hypothetical protein
VHSTFGCGELREMISRDMMFYFGRGDLLSF